jgi:endonuclease/exonuclease/phosphatase family metal-dependent hydrolase
MNYSLLKDTEFLPQADRGRTISNLQALREQLTQALPAKDAEDHMLLATWNVRDLGKPEKERRGFGPRLAETHFYIAEVISRFDFVAVQEVNELEEWERVMRILGPDWDYIATDVTDRRLGGNGERLAFAFDSRKVSFRHIAGEIVLPAGALVSENVVPQPAHARIVGAEVAGAEVGRQFVRSPFVASFQSLWFKFDICTVHIYYGKESGPKLRERIEEIRSIASYFGARAEDALARKKSLILLGDFNIVHPEHETMKALLDAGFETAKALKDARSNIGQDKFYDQVAFRTHPGVLAYTDTPTADGKPRAGVFDIFANVFTAEQFPDYETAVKASPTGGRKPAAELQEYYMDWRTYQFSDHRPMWLQLKVNDSASYLDQLPRG